MTCIVGIASGGKVYMGADSLGSDGWSTRAYATPKLIRVSERLLVGYASSYRAGNLLSLLLRQDVDGILDDASYDAADRALDIVEAIRKVWAEGGHLERKDARESAGDLLLGFDGHLFNVGTDLGVIESASGFDAIGSGFMVALGSLHTTGVIGAGSISPSTRLTFALEAAADMVGGVGPPFYYQTV